MRLALEPGEDIAVMVRRTAAESCVVVVSPSLDPLARAVTRATIAPLAVELAPGGRLNAVFPAQGVAPDVIDAACAYLEQAKSTTGQVLDIV